MGKAVARVGKTLAQIAQELVPKFRELQEDPGAYVACSVALGEFSRTYFDVCVSKLELCVNDDDCLAFLIEGRLAQAQAKGDGDGQA